MDIYGFFDRQSGETYPVNDQTARALARTAASGATFLNSFDGSTPEARLYDALAVKQHKGSIACGEIKITSTVSLPYLSLRGVSIVGATITLEADLFTSDASYTGIPSFVNCHFIGNGHAIFGGAYVIGAQFIGCQFDNCSIINNASAILQSCRLIGCDVQNSVPLIKADRIYDVHLDHLTCEAQSATLVDTSACTYYTGGTQQLWVSDSIFEGFSAPVFDLSGGRIAFNNCYFEANAQGCARIQRAEGALNLLHLQVTSCKFNQQSDAFTITGFTADYRVKVQFWDNSFSSGDRTTALVRGLPSNDMLALYGNSTGSAYELITPDALPRYDAWNLMQPTPNGDYFTLNSDGYIQFGRLVFVDFTFIVKAEMPGRVETAFSAMPPVAHYGKLLPVVVAGNGSDTGVTANVSANGNISISAPLAPGGTVYRIYGFYFTR